MIEIAVDAHGAENGMRSARRAMHVKPLAITRSMTCWICSSVAPSCMMMTMMVRPQFL